MKRIILSISLILCSLITFAQGGMWLPALVGDRIKDMQSKGFKLSADDIYSVNKACMKDAVMLFGGGCTAEIVSGQGLVLTNHHCGRSYIQAHSTLAHDYLTNGFWALCKDDELPCKGLEVKMLCLMEEIPASKGDMSVSANRASVINEYTSKYGSGYSYDIESFYAGNVYYVFVYQIFTDVRLVGAPPSAIGNFGGDTDNWMWPRHSGDFSVFRIYAGKDNKPAPYSPDNKPYTPKHHFKISLKGVSDGDFTMVFGFPGTTEENLPACAVRERVETLYPARVYVRQNIMDVMQKYIDESRAVRLKYTSRMAGVENAKKKWEGAVIGMRRFDVVQQKLDFESQFGALASKNPEYSTILPKYNELYSSTLKERRADAYFTEALWGLMQIKLGEKLFKRFRAINASSSDASILEAVNSALDDVNSIFASRDSALERSLFKSMYKIYGDSCAGFFPESTPEKYRNMNIGSHAEFPDRFYELSVVSDSAKFQAWANQWIQATKLGGKKRSARINELKSDFESDPANFLYYDFLDMYFSKLYASVGSFEKSVESLDKLYQKAIMELIPGAIQFPDANLTLRFTYGKVEGFEPRDGVVYKPFTTLEGVIEKDNPDIYDYHVPERLKNLYRFKNYGRYADKADGKIHVCFAASNHTTGGNSGSPVVNANGELIGINFDRCWEGTMSDIQYRPEICRNISVDIRYVLFLIDKLGNARNIVDEMDIVE
ncbi:MAG: S46 family peptidase [Bacteroidales bacterium]|nr:S46 family peptidase [Bacteroidales bacterium]